MEISRDMRTVVDKQTVEQRKLANKKQPFQTLLVKEGRQLHKERLHALLGNIQSQGERLVRSRTAKELHQYKRLIEKFVKEAVDFGLELKHTGGWNHFGQKESHTLVDQVDKELLALTEMIFEEGKDSLDILGKVGEIEGLLINLYT